MFDAYFFVHYVGKRDWTWFDELILTHLFLRHTLFTLPNSCLAVTLAKTGRDNFIGASLKILIQ